MLRTGPVCLFECMISDYEEVCVYLKKSLLGFEFDAWEEVRWGKFEEFEWLLL